MSQGLTLPPPPPWKGWSLPPPTLWVGWGVVLSPRGGSVVEKGRTMGYSPDKATGIIT